VPEIIEAEADALVDAELAAAGEGPFDPILPDSPPRYPHVFKTLMERPWAIQAEMLSMMVDIVRFRVQGGRMSKDEISAVLEAAAADNPERRSDGSFDVGSVRVIPVYGVISQRMGLMSMVSGGTSLDVLRGQVRGALADQGISAVVLQFDSPGGSVDGLTEFAAELRGLRDGPKPIVGIADSLAASAAYWLLCQCTEAIVTPSGSVGSVGVFAAHEDQSAAEEMAGIKTTLVAAGPFKTEGNPHEPLSDDARTTIQGYVDAYYGMFTKDVAAGRGTTAALVVANYGGGREVLAQDALKAGMVDRVDTLENTVRRLLPRQGRSSRSAEAAPVEVGDVAPDMPAIAATAVETLPIAASAVATRTESRAAPRRRALSAEQRDAFWGGFSTTKGN
jgi:signal peptide peptidase SppA